MSLARLLAAMRSPMGRAAAGLAGVSCVALIVRGIGAHSLARALAGAAVFFPAVLALEGAQVACTTLAMRSLYGPRVPRAQLLRAGIIGYAVMGVFPAGRAVAEVARASLLTRWVGAARATAAAARIQVAALFANALISAIAAAAVALAVPAPAWLPIAIAGNAVAALAMGASLALAARRRPGAWLGRVVPKARGFGADLDGVLETERGLPAAAAAWEFAGRLCQVAQNAVLLACVGGAPGLGSALASEGIHLVGAAVGDLIPGQLGATEGNYTLAASALGLPVASAVAIALLAHLSQLTYVLVGSLISAAWPAQAPPAAARGETASSAPVQG
jgi:hypothetical protein